MQVQRHRSIGGSPIHFHGWRADRPDFRDAHYAKPMVSDVMAAKLPSSMHGLVKPWDSTIGIYDQGNIGSCTAHGSVEAFRWLYWKAKMSSIPDFSRLAQYAWTRLLIEGTPLSDDSGCMIRDAVKCMAKYGLAPEAAWQYDTTLFDMNPPAEAMREASSHQILSYHRVPNITGIKAEIANWYPVIIGFTCYESLQSPKAAQTGLIPIPGPGESTIGGHCITLAGYDDTIPVGNGQHGGFIFPQSWGRGWGKTLGFAGWGVLPYWYFTHGQASDFWVVHTEEGVSLP
jgi:C1A family cysteine protease